MATTEMNYVEGGGYSNTAQLPFTFNSVVSCPFTPKKIVYQIIDSGVGGVLIIYEDGKLDEYYGNPTQHYDVTSSMSSFLEISGNTFTIKSGSGTWVSYQYYAYVEG